MLDAETAALTSLSEHAGYGMLDKLLLALAEDNGLAKLDTLRLMMSDPNIQALKAVKKQKKEWGEATYGRMQQLAQDLYGPGQQLLTGSLEHYFPATTIGAEQLPLETERAQEIERVQRQVAQDLADKRQRLLRGRVGLERLNGELDDLRDAMQSESARMAGLRAKIAEGQKTVATEQAAKARVAAEHEKVRSSISSKESDVEHLKGRTKTLSGEIKQYEFARDTATALHASNMAMYKARVDKLTEQLWQLEKKAQELLEQQKAAIVEKSSSVEAARLGKTSAVSEAEAKVRARAEAQHEKERADLLRLISTARRTIHDLLQRAGRTIHDLLQKTGRSGDPAAADLHALYLAQQYEAGQWETLLTDPVHGLALAEGVQEPWGVWPSRDDPRLRLFVRTDAEKMPTAYQYLQTSAGSGKDEEETDEETRMHMNTASTPGNASAQAKASAPASAADTRDVVIVDMADDTEDDEVSTRSLS